MQKGKVAKEIQGRVVELVVACVLGSGKITIKLGGGRFARRQKGRVGRAWDGARTAVEYGGMGRLGKCGREGGRRCECVDGGEREGMETRVAVVEIDQRLAP